MACRACDPQPRDEIPVRHPPQGEHFTGWWPLIFRDSRSTPRYRSRGHRTFLKASRGLPGAHRLKRSLSSAFWFVTGGILVTGPHYAAPLERLHAERGVAVVAGGGAREIWTIVQRKATTFLSNPG